MNKAFFLDRDGTINDDTGYIDSPERVSLLPEVSKAIRRINEAGYLVIVISNQSGVARGFFDENMVESVNNKINQLLSNNGAHIDAFYYCPHLKIGNGSKYDFECNCRKPKPGMFLRAIKDYDLNIKECYACGDKKRDVECLPYIGMPITNIGIIGDNTLYYNYNSLLDFVNNVLN